MKAEAETRLGLRENLPQFLLLVLINAFVGGMVGLQRTVLPLIGEEVFLLPGATFITSFIITFGIVKACANLFSGALADRYGRRRVLILGWLIGVPVPFMLGWADRWEWIVAANVLLGVNQGLAWSMTVVMKVDLVGPARRGLALGLNEFAGYLAVGVTAWATAEIAAAHGLRPAPFYLGIAYAAIGLALSVFLVRDTTAHARLEAQRRAARDGAQEAAPSLAQVFALTTFRRRDLFGACQAGLVNNLNDGMAWGVFPLLLASWDLSVRRIGVIAALYPATWGVSQLFFGGWSDRIGRKPLIVWGMLVQAAAHGVFALGAGAPMRAGVIGAVMLGVGTGMVYPTLLAAVSDASHPLWRARSLSVYRFWRDLGYAAGALMAGIVADAFELVSAVHAAGVVTLISGLVAWRVMRETLPE